MNHLSLDDFETRYRREGDPWGYETSPYERDKYAATLAACGPGPFTRALELGASIGVLSALLAPRCERLVTVDGAPTAVAAARERLAGVPGVEIRCGAIPEAIPDGPYDLVLASEILYYLPAEALRGTLERIRETTRPGARIVAVHWRPNGPERPGTADGVHALLRAQDWLTTIDAGVSGTDDYRLDVLERIG